MKQAVQTYRSPLLIAAAGFIVLLLLMCGGLYRQNKHYQQENRRLIIQNDSLMSVNIELSGKAKKYQTGSFPIHKAAYKAITGKDK